MNTQSNIPQQPDIEDDFIEDYGKDSKSFSFQASVAIPEGFKEIDDNFREIGDFWLCVSDIECSSFTWQPVTNLNSIPSSIVIRRI